MRKLIVTNIVSLDGYYEGPGKDVMVLPMDHSFDAYNVERMREADTVLLGRTSYDAFKGFWPAMEHNPDATPDHREFARLDNAIDKVVVLPARSTARTTYWSGTPRVVRRREKDDQTPERPSRARSIDGPDRATQSASECEITPPSTVSQTPRSAICSDGVVNRSPSRTTRSASLPVSSEPSRSSMPSANAASIVWA